MMRGLSNLYLTAALSGLMVMMFLLGVILVRGAGPAGRGNQLTTVSKHSEARSYTTPENGAEPPWILVSRT
jgi:hypothetical protein